MINISIYPFTHQSIYLAKHLIRHSKYSLKKLVCFEESMSNLKEETLIKEYLTSNFEDSIQKTDIFLVDEDIIKRTKEGRIIWETFAKKIEDKGKEVRYFNSCEERDTNNISMNDILGEEIPKLYHVSHNIPVVLISGLFSRQSVFDLHLSLKEKFDSKFENAYHIGCSKISDIFDMENLPEYLFSNSLSETEKILILNNQIKECCSKNNVEILVISIPNGLISYSRKCVGDFGSLAFKISNAIPINNLITLVPYMDYTIQDFEQYYEAINRNLGLETDNFVFESKTINLSKSDTFFKEHYISIKDQIVIDKVDELKTDSVGSIKDQIFLDNIINNIATQFA